MDATIVARTPTSFTPQVEVPYNDSMPDLEEALQHRLDEAGVVATAEGLQQFDTDGSPTRAPGAGRPTARSTGTPGSSSAPPHGSPRRSPTSTPSSVRLGSRSTWRRIMAGWCPAA